MKLYRYACWILPLILPVCLAAQGAGDYVCSAADFKGVYTFSWHDASHQYDSEDNLLPVSNPVVGVGFFVADGIGQYTGEMKIWARSWQNAAQSYNLSALDKRYTVNADCTGSGTWAHPATGATIYEYQFVVMNGGKELHIIGLTGDPLGLVIAKRVEPDDQELQTKVDALTAELAEAKKLLQNVARVLGVLRP